MVVVKLPELEKIATEPLSRVSPGLSPPSAPPIRTRFQASATPRPLAPKMSMPFVWPMARISRASWTETFSVTMMIFSRSGIDPDQLGHAVAHRRGRQVDHAGVEAVAGVEALAHRVEHRHVADRRLQLLAAAAGRGAEDDVAAGEGVADRRHVAGFAAQDVEHADPVVARRDLGQRVDADEVFEAGDALLVHGCCSSISGAWVQAALRMPRRCATCSRPPAFIQRSAAWA